MRQNKAIVLSRVLTADGSFTLFSTRFNAHYHSLNGAVTESKHVFIQNGLQHLVQCSSGTTSLTLLEMGLGTGLNALLVWQFAEEHGLHIHYTALELYPPEPEQLTHLAYPQAEKLELLHHADWHKEMALSPCFLLLKRQEDLTTYMPQNEQFSLILFDAFSPAEQFDLWSVDVFVKLIAATRPGGVLVTYCAKGQVRRNMQAVGWMVERLPGAPGKREMLRATKPAF